MQHKKETGTYYTPPLLADFIVFHLFSQYEFKKTIRVLEPSSGGGVFFESLFNNQNFDNTRYNLRSTLLIDAVEMEGAAIELTKERTSKYVQSPHSINFIHEDYLKFHSSNDSRYDLIIGNPPYIKRHHLDPEQVKLCEAIHERSNLGNKRIKNIWTSFLLGAEQALSDEGVMCFVLPAELLQVIYAKELRDYLKEKFEYIEIFAFNDLIFEEIEQDVVILVCAKRHKKQGVAFFQVEHLEDLKEPLYVQKNSNVHRKTLDKWTNYVLSDADLKFLDAIRAKLRPIKDYCRAEVGIVTAANDYFIVDRGTVRDYHLEAIARPIIKKGSHIQSTLYMREADYLQGIENGVPGYFLEFPDSEVSMPASYESYLQEGVRRGLTERYKMKLRKKWYIIPSLWVPEGFFTKRSNIFPRMMVNEARLMVTDSFYRILMKEGYRIEDLTFSFYNSLTMIFAELEGRFYGGSVLELTPSEYKNLIVPYHPRVPKRHLAKLDELLKKGAGVEEIMAYTDKILLCDHFGLNEEDAERLKRIYKKLLLRRLKGKKYTKA